MLQISSPDLWLVSSFFQMSVFRNKSVWFFNVVELVHLCLTGQWSWEVRESYHLGMPPCKFHHSPYEKVESISPSLKFEPSLWFALASHTQRIDVLWFWVSASRDLAGFTFIHLAPRDHHAIEKPMGWKPMEGERRVSIAGPLAGCNHTSEPRWD